MSKLPVVSGAQCVRALEKTGFVVYRQRGSHITLIRAEPRAQTTVPNHKELDRGTLDDGLLLVNRQAFGETSARYRGRF